MIGAITAWNAPDADRHVEARSGARRGQRRRAQAGGGRAADLAAPRDADRGGRLPGGRRQRAARASARRPAPRSCAIPASTRSASPAAPRSAARSPSRPPATFRRVTLELGGKSPQIVLADADLSAVLPGIAVGFLANQGEICAAGTRILVARELYDDVVAVSPTPRAACTSAIRSTRHDDGRAHQRQAARPRDRLHRAGQGRGRRARHRRWAARSPGLLRRADGVRGHRATRSGSPRTRSSGPSRSCCRSTTPSRRSSIANDTRYGLAAYVWTQNLSEAHRLAAQLRAGGVWINGPGAPDARLPWGGVKTSGIGRELGWAGIEGNTEEKTVTITF